jgi:caffeoyl-CoA O-methyltransferase
MDMTPQRWRYTNAYAHEVFGRQDEHLAGLMAEAAARGLPEIAVNAEVGRLLMMLTAMTSAKLAIELGTLAGYSGIWIARGLAPDGRLITVEREPSYAAFAREQFKRANVAERVEVRCGAALDLLPQLASEVGPRSVDLFFVDALKTEYPDYWLLARPLIKPGGLIVADNVYGGGTWWIDDVGNEARQAIDRFNRLVTGDPDFEAIAVPLREGVLIGRRKA